MSTQTKTKPKSQKNNGAPASIVWFEIPADNVERARTFYGKLFGWKIERFPGPKPYWHIDTGGAEATPDGGMMERQCPEQSVTNYVGVTLRTTHLRSGNGTRARNSLLTCRSD